jgi:hypothetical protein
MYARLTSLTGSDEDSDQAAVASLRAVPGFRGLTLGVGGDRARRTLLTVWAGELAASGEALAAISGRPTAAAACAAPLAHLAMIVPETAVPASRGALHRIVWVRMAPDDVGAQARYFRYRVIPENLLAADGFLGARFLVDLSTGQGLVSTLWRDEAATVPVDALGAGRRERGISRGIEIGEPRYEHVVAHSWESDG